MSQHTGVTAILGNRDSDSTKAKFDDGEMMKWSGTGREEKSGHGTKSQRACTFNSAGSVCMES